MWGRLAICGRGRRGVGQGCEVRGWGVVEGCKCGGVVLRMAFGKRGQCMRGNLALQPGVLHACGEEMPVGCWE